MNVNERIDNRLQLYLIIFNQIFYTRILSYNVEQNYATMYNYFITCITSELLIIEYPASEPTRVRVVRPHVLHHLDPEFVSRSRNVDLLLDERVGVGVNFSRCSPRFPLL